MFQKILAPTSFGLAGIAALGLASATCTAQVSLVTDSRVCSASVEGPRTFNPGGNVYPASPFSVFNGLVAASGLEYSALGAQNSSFDLAARHWLGNGAADAGIQSRDGFSGSGGSQANFTFSVGPVTRFTMDFTLVAYAGSTDGGSSSSDSVAELRDASNNIIFQYSVAGGDPTNTITPGTVVVLNGGTYTFKCFSLGQAQAPDNVTPPYAHGAFQSNFEYAVTYEKCVADFNSDGIVDYFDYLDFLDAYEANDPSADVNGDGIVDFFDYLDFVASFESGC